MRPMFVHGDLETYFKGNKTTKISDRMFAITLAINSWASTATTSMYSTIAQHGLGKNKKESVSGWEAHSN